MTGSFSMRQVVAATGASYRQADYWCRRGLVPGAERGPGSGFPRRLSFGQVLRIALLTACSQAGVRPGDVPARLLAGDGTVRLPGLEFTIDLVALAADLRAKLEEPDA